MGEDAHQSAGPRAAQLTRPMLVYRDSLMLFRNFSITQCLEECPGFDLNSACMPL